MNSRRHFLCDVAVGVAALLFRFRPEAKLELAEVRVVASGEWGEYRWVMSKMVKPFHPPSFPISVHRCE